MRRICKSRTADERFTNSSSVSPTSQVVYHAYKKLETCGQLLLYNNSEDRQFFHEFTGTITDN